MSEVRRLRLLLDSYEIEYINSLSSLGTATQLVETLRAEAERKRMDFMKARLAYLHAKGRA